LTVRGPDIPSQWEDAAMMQRLLVLVILCVGHSFASAQETLPKKVDLKTQFDELKLPARQQGGRGTCVFFSVTALVDFEVARSLGEPQEQFAEEYLVWAARQATGRSGGNFTKAVRGLNAFGLCPESEMPYGAKDDETRKPSAAAQSAAGNLAQRWQMHWLHHGDFKVTLTESEVTAIKRALHAGHPVGAAFILPKKMTADILQVPGAEDRGGIHAVVLVGYADDPDLPGGGAFTFRNSWGPRWGRDGYGTVSYAFARANGLDVMWLDFGPKDSEKPLARFEVESLPIVQKALCQAAPQDMTPFGAAHWSGGSQLLVRAQKGGWVEVSFTVAKAGRYRTRTLATFAPDFGRIEFVLDGKAVPGVFDLYSGEVLPSDSLELGTHELTAGKHTLRLRVVGKNDASKGYYFGIDTLDLLTPL
jgi:hypothetical protein